MTPSSKSDSRLEQSTCAEADAGHDNPEDGDASEARLTYGAMARAWLERLPLGDGTLGAMLGGGTAVSQIDLNHETAWSGGPRSEERGRHVSPADAKAAVEQARQLIADGEPASAEAVLKPLQARYGQSYLPLAHLTIRRAQLDQERTGTAPSRRSGRVG